MCRIDILSSLVLETIALSITAVVILLRAPTNVRRIARITIENTILSPGQKTVALIIFPLLHIFYLVALTTAGGPVIVFCYGFYDMIRLGWHSKIIHMIRNIFL